MNHFQPEKLCVWKMSLPLVMLLCFAMIYVVISLPECEEIAGNYVCNCREEDACYNQTIQCRNNQMCTIYCTGDYSCMDATILCPNSTNSNYPCNIWCGDGFWNCFVLTVQAFTSKLHITSFGAWEALQQSKIYAQNSPNLTMEANGNHPTCNILHHSGWSGFDETNIYSVSSFAGLNMRCGDNNVSNCWNPANYGPPVMHCGNNYTSRCDMTVDDEMNWNCLNSSYECYVTEDEHGNAIMDTFWDLLQQYYVIIILSIVIFILLCCVSFCWKNRNKDRQNINHGGYRYNSVEMEGSESRTTVGSSFTRKYTTMLTK